MANFTLFAQNTDVDYVQQACLCAMSIHATNKDAKVALITNDNVPNKYKDLFEHIVEIPWGDHAQEEEWKISNRWKIYHASPFKDGTAVLDTDMLILQDLTYWFKKLENYDLFYTSDVVDYRGNKITSDYYRKAFTKFNLPNLYSGFHYFKESDLSHEFYTWLEMITNNWYKFYKTHAGGKTYQKKCSMDLSAAIAANIMNCEEKITDKSNIITFAHMKAPLFNWTDFKTESWQNRLSTYLTNNLELYVGNYVQNGIFHYTEDNFCNDTIIKKYENYLGI